MNSIDGGRWANDLVMMGYRPVRIAAGSKKSTQKGWQRGGHEPAAWKPGEGVGVLCGTGGLVAVDIDTDDPGVIQAVQAALPTGPAKRGAKGQTLFLITPGVVRNFYVPVGFGEGIGSEKGKWKLLRVEVLAARRQSVLPPSVHPDTGEPYRWLDSAVTLYNVPLDELPIVEGLEARLRDALAPWTLPKALIGACQTVAGAAEGERNEALNREVFLLAKGEHVIPYEMGRRWLTAAGRHAGLTESEIDATWRSAVTAGSEKVKAPARSPALVPPPPEPWPHEVQGTALLAEMEAAFRHHLALRPYVAEISALWALATHGQLEFDHFPHIFMHSPERGCGKSAFIEILSHVVYRGKVLNRATVPGCIRVLEKVGQGEVTLLLDEADNYVETNYINFLNSSFTRDATFLQAASRRGEDYEAKEYPVYCALAFARIGGMHDAKFKASVSRTIEWSLGRTNAAERKGTVRFHRGVHDYRDLSRKCARWWKDNREAVRSALRRTDAELGMPEHDDARYLDVWRGLFALAYVVRGKWPELVQKACSELFQDYVEDRVFNTELGQVVLRALSMCIVHEAKGYRWVETVDLCKAIGDDEDFPHADRFKAAALNPKSAGRTLERAFQMFADISKAAKFSSSKRGFRVDELLAFGGRYGGTPKMIGTLGTVGIPVEKQGIISTRNTEQFRDENGIRPPGGAVLDVATAETEALVRAGLPTLHVGWGLFILRLSDAELDRYLSGMSLDAVRGLLAGLETASGSTALYAARRITDWLGRRKPVSLTNGHDKGGFDA